MGVSKYFTDMIRRDKEAQLERVTIIDPPEPLEGTRMSLWNSILPNWYAEQDGSMVYGDATLASRVWVTNVCQDLTAAQIAAMPLQWHGTAGTLEPAWVSSPDPSQFPNGIGEAIYAIQNQIDGWGWSCQLIIDRYDSGYPRRWMVLDSSACEPRFNDEGRKVYKLGERELNPADVVQIDRNPTLAAHGTSAIRAFAQNAYALLAAGNQSQVVSQGGIPQAVLKSEHRLTADQAADAQTAWMSRVASRNGAPAVLGQGWTFEPLSINPADLSLLDTQQWNAMVLATAYGVPGPVLNMALTGGLTYQNPLALMQMWWMTRLRTKAKRIVDAFTAQMLPRGQWVSVDASDITQEINQGAEDDPQLSQVAKASPAQQARPLTAIGGGSP